MTIMIIPIDQGLLLMVDRDNYSSIIMQRYANITLYLHITELYFLFVRIPQQVEVLKQAGLNMQQGL